MNEEWKQMVLEMILKPDARIMAMRGVKDVTKPDARWVEYEAGKTLYVMIAVGPIDAHVENSIRAALGHDSMSFVKETES